MPDFKKLPTVNSTAVALVDHVHPTGLALWLDAGQISGLADGAAVGTWADLSGNGRNATQATGGNKPLFKTNILNGRPVVRFDGTDDYLACATGAAIAQPTTVILVARHASIPTDSPVRFLFDGQSARQAMWGSAGTWNIYANNTVSGGVPDTRAHVVTVRFQGASSVLRVDGVQVAAGDAGASSLDGLVLGIATNLASNPLEGDIAEVRVYGLAMTTVEMNQVEFDLATKYGIGAAGFASAVKWMTD